MIASKKPQAKKKRITLRDVIFHMQGMEDRLTKKIEANATAIKTNAIAIQYNTKRINEVESNLTEQIDTLEENLESTITTTLTIMRHVKMPIQD